MSQDHSHLTTEQLSAWLDQQLPTDEQEWVATHVQQCAQCQACLSDLKQTVALLHALPRPQAPRSFTLSAEVLNAYDAPATPITSLPIHARSNPRRNSGLRTTMSVISTLAAVVGICFLLSSVVPGVSQNSATSNSSSGSSMAPNTSHSGSQSQSNPSAQKTATAQSKNGTAPSITPAPNNSNHTTTSPPTILDLSQPTGRALLGIILVVLGLLCFLLLRAQQPRAP